MTAAQKKAAELLAQQELANTETPKVLTLQERIAQAKAERTNDKFEDIGTLDDYLGDGGIMEFNPRNLKRHDKDVIIDLYPIDFQVGDNVRTLVLGRGLSAEFRAKTVLADHLLSMHISRRIEDDVWFITLEQAEGLQISTSQLNSELKRTQETFNINDLIGLGV